MTEQPKSGGRLHAEMLVGVAAVVIGVAALAVSLYEARLMRAEQRAAVLPILGIGMSYGFETEESEQLRLQFVAENVGTGPARIRDFRVTVDGRAMPDWSEVIGELLGDNTGFSYTHSFINRRTLPAERKLVMFELRDNALAQRLYEQMERIDMHACYCSVFEDCWQISVQARAEPATVAECPSETAASFEQ